MLGGMRVNPDEWADIDSIEICLNKEGGIEAWIEEFKFNVEAVIGKESEKDVLKWKLKVAEEQIVILNWLLWEKEETKVEIINSNVLE